MKNKNKSDEATIQSYVNKESPIELPRRSLLKVAIATTAPTLYPFKHVIETKLREGYN